MRIASLSPAATEILFALEAGDQIVCRDQFSDMPEEVKQIPGVRGHAKVRPEDLSVYKPDLILTGTIVQERLAEELRQHGYSVVHQDPRTLPAIEESIRALGILLERERQADALVLSMRQGFQDVKRKAALLPRRLRLYIEEWHQPPFASGNWVPEVARIAGGEYFPMPAGELSREVTFDQVSQFDPDMMVISWCGAGLLADRELLCTRPGWDRLRAVRDGKVRVIDDSLLNRPGPRLVEGAQRLYGWMFEILH